MEPGTPVMMAITALQTPLVEHGAVQSKSIPNTIFTVQ
jgi:hypothetical protein